MAPFLTKARDALLLVGLAARCCAANNVRGAVVTPSTATEVFEEELKNPAGDKDRAARVAHITDVFRPVYASLEKKTDGTVSHEAARYLLHRFFMNEHGWDIRGLSGKGSSAALEKHRNVHSYSTLKVNEWLMPHLFDVLQDREKKLGETGASLEELAAVAETVEDLAAKDFAKRLEGLLELLELPTEGMVPKADADKVMDAFLMQFLMSGNVTSTTRREALDEVQEYTELYDGWAEADAWMTEVERQHMRPDARGLVDLADAKRVVAEVGMRYYVFNEPQCKDMKNTLLKIEGAMPGRARLSSFYSKSLASHWKFRESADYLRVLGSLDESDPKQPHVVIPNYVMSTSNCLKASVFYEICCRNACEDLMGHLERHIGAAEGEPMRIAALIEELPSDSVAAPRNLSQQLLGRLSQVAAANNGKVPLHGRLFAQWMHHAYPRDCPYPFESNVMPQTPDEWLENQGHAGASATSAQMQAQIESDTCAFSPEGPRGCGGNTELPWSDTEELLTPRGPAARPAMPAVDKVTEEAKKEVPAPAGHMATAFSVLALVALAALLLLAERRLQLALWRARALLAVLGGVACGLVNFSLLIVGLVGAMLFFAFQVGTARLSLGWLEKAQAKGKDKASAAWDSRYCV